MTVCLDTGVFLQIFGRKQPFQPILRALLDGQITLAVSTEILFEYQEIITQLSGAERWHDVASLLELLPQLHGNIRRASPQFRLNVISTDPDDNKFCDCDCCRSKIRRSAGYKPKPIKPDEFIRQFLSL
ncbi:MAG TPA: PIN domain-containing protein [Verrucomicrobiae bacterium]|nr:PIN domain-containing protein [Verrucomicrobiae bacterium]